MKTTISEKGQVTIPKAVRERLGLVPGTQLDMQARDGQLIGTKVLAQDVFGKWRGSGRLPRGMSVDAYLDAVRDRHADRG